MGGQSLEIGGLHPVEGERGHWSWGAVEVRLESAKGATVEI